MSTPDAPYGLTKAGKPRKRPPREGEGRHFFDTKSEAEELAILTKLETAFSIGCTDAEACIYADISLASLYKYQVAHPEFDERKRLLKEKPILKARTAVVKSLDDPDRAFRFLGVKAKDEFAPRSPLTDDKGRSLLSVLLDHADKPPEIPKDQSTAV